MAHGKFDECLDIILNFKNSSAEKMRVYLKYSNRKTLSLSLMSSSEIKALLPRGTRKEILISFINKKKKWLYRQIMMKKEEEQNEPLDELEISSLKIITMNRINAFMKTYDGPMPEKFVLRRQKSRWGSCSSKGVISININAGFLPDKLFNYLMLHELTHLEEMNHGPAFWEKLESKVKGAKSLQKELKKIPFRP